MFVCFGQRGVELASFLAILWLFVQKTTTFRLLEMADPKFGTWSMFSSVTFSK